VLFRARTVGGGEDDPAFYRAIQRLRPGGSTALYHGTVTGAAELQPFIDEGYIPTIVLLSDGIANVGPSSTEDLAAWEGTCPARISPSPPSASAWTIMKT
jgi:Ca-activated chloride channel family protein